MKRGTRKLSFSKLTVFLIVGTVLFPICLLNISAQRRGRVYNRFDHNVAPHKRQSCSECHKSPTGVSSTETASGENYRYPDITDYPDHDSCLDCHRQQFFRGARPAICSICHTKVSPRDEARFAFSKANQASEFRIKFPHDIHQDIIAKRTTPSPRSAEVAAAHFVNAKFTAQANFQDDKRPDFNNCAICHAPAPAKIYSTATRPLVLETGQVVPAHREKFPDAKYLEEKNKKSKEENEAGGRKDSAYTFVGHFKGVPNGHDSCFNCHYSQQKLPHTDCRGCHILTDGRIAESNVIERISLKFHHDEVDEEKSGPDRFPHNKDCTVCHIRITQSSELRLLEPDVKIFSCGGNCHADEVKGEISLLEDKKIQSCSYCHGAYIGLLPIPSSHTNIK